MPRKNGVVRDQDAIRGYKRTQKNLPISRRCRVCRVTKPIEDFKYKCKKTLSGYAYLIQCIPCLREIRKKYQEEETSEDRRKKWLRSKYNMTLEEYN